MDSKAASTRDYQDYVPETEVVQEEDCETLLISLPGFRKDQLRVQLTSTPSLKISGERPTGGNKWIQFQKEYPISPNCEQNKITARFEDGVLHIRQPKLITPAVKNDEEKLGNEAQKPQPPLPQPTEMKNASKQRDEAKSEGKKEEHDKFHDADTGDLAQKYPEDKGSDNDEKVKRKRPVNELGKGELVLGRVLMAKKIGRMTSVVVVVLLAVVIGIYVKNLIMSAKSYEN